MESIPQKKIMESSRLK